jgi:TatD DNase family protein
MFVDSHAHLFFKDFKNELDAVLARAREAGVNTIICPGTDLATSRESVELAEKHEMVYAAVGVHPHDASGADSKVLEEIERLSHHQKVVAIGEIGLDYHYNYSPHDRQKEVLQAQIDIARRRGLPVILHTRESEEDLLGIIGRNLNDGSPWLESRRREHDRYEPPRGVVHCFPGDPAMAWKLIEWGFYISLTGPVTFGKKPGKPNSMMEVAEHVSAEHILLETDSPYLTPAPHRGKRNEPAYIPLIAKAVADCQHLSVEDIARTSSFGVLKLFGIGKYPEPTIAYTLNNSLYLNITIRCNADCVFCDRKGEALIKGYNLKIEKEPSAADVVTAIGDPTRYREIVFCGYGEPTIRLDVLKEVASSVKKSGGKVRLNTDGHGSVINGRNIVPELVGFVDSVSISLNSTDPEQYGKLMRVDPAKFFPAMVAFARECVRCGLDTTMTIVDQNSVNEEKARKFVENDVGAKFRNRPFF